MAEDWVHLQLGMCLQIGVLRYFTAFNVLKFNQMLQEFTQLYLKCYHAHEKGFWLVDKLDLSQELFTQVMQYIDR